MRKINISKEQVVNFARGLGNVLVFGAMMAAPYISRKDVLDKMRYMGNVNYSDAVNAVLDSDMLSSSRTTVISMLPKGESADFYKSVIAVVNSDMLSSNKVDIIKDICKGLPKEES